MDEIRRGQRDRNGSPYPEVDLERVASTRILRSLMERDSLTGALGHTYIVSHLANEVSRAALMAFCSSGSLVPNSAQVLSS